MRAGDAPGLRFRQPEGRRRRRLVRRAGFRRCPARRRRRGGRGARAASSDSATSTPARAARRGAPRGTERALLLFLRAFLTGFARTRYYLTFLIGRQRRSARLRRGRRHGRRRAARRQAWPGGRQSAGRRGGTFDAFDVALRGATLVGNGGRRFDAARGRSAGRRDGAGFHGSVVADHRERRMRRVARRSTSSSTAACRWSASAACRRSRGRCAQRTTLLLARNERELAVLDAEDDTHEVILADGAAGCADADRGRSAAGVAVCAALRTPGVRGKPAAVARSGRAAAVRVCGAGRIEERRAAEKDEAVECAPAPTRTA